MDASSLDLLVDYAIRLSPGLGLALIWFWLTPNTETGLRIAILLLAFVLIRDAMTPLGLWSPEPNLRLFFISDPIVLAALGSGSVVLIVLLLRMAPDLSKLVVWRKNSLIEGLAVGAALGAAIGLPVRLYHGIDMPLLETMWPWLAGMIVLAYGGNALEEVLFRGFLQGHLEQLLSPVRAALASGVAFGACHSFLALTVTGLGWPLLAFTLVEGLACACVRLKYGVMAATVTHGTAILLIAERMGTS